MAKTLFEPVPQVSVPVGHFQQHAVKAWFALFPASALVLFFSQPALGTSVLGVALMTALVLVAAMVASSVQDELRSNIGPAAIGLVAPVQVALMIWVSVHAGHSLAGDNLILSTLAAFAAFIALVLVDFAVSVVALIWAGRNAPVSGIPVACLISGKYAGLLGQTV